MPRRTIVDRPGDQFLARARLAEDQHGGIGAGDQFHPLHHRAEPRFDADDRIAQGFASQPRQQRAFVGLGGLAQGGHLPQPQVVFQGHGKRLQQQLRQLGVLLVEDAAGGGQKDQQAAMPRRIAQRPGQHVAVEPAENERGQLRRRRFDRPGDGPPFSGGTTPAAIRVRPAVQSVRASGRRCFRPASPTATVSRHERAASIRRTSTCSIGMCRTSMEVILVVDWLMSMCRHASCQTLKSTC